MDSFPIRLPTCLWNPQYSVAKFQGAKIVNSRSYYKLMFPAYESAPPPALSHSPSLAKVKADCQHLPGAKQNLLISAWIVWWFLLFEHLSPFWIENSVFETVKMFPFENGRVKALSLFFFIYFYFLAKIIYKSWPRRFYPPCICVIPWLVMNRESLSLLRGTCSENHLQISHSSQLSCQAVAFMYLLCSWSLI